MEPLSPDKSIDDVYAAMQTVKQMIAADNKASRFDQVHNLNAGDLAELLA
jgi:hypothetical protein